MRPDDRRIRSFWHNEQQKIHSMTSLSSIVEKGTLECIHGYESLYHTNLLSSNSGGTKRQRLVTAMSSRNFIRFCLLLLLLLIPIWFKGLPVARLRSFLKPAESASSCAQVEPLYPTAHVELTKKLEDLYESQAFRLKAYESLGGVIRIPTETYDDLKAPGEDERWKVYDKMHDYLSLRFPLLHNHLNITKVNTYALVYQWQGSEESLEPILLTAHQDVVPVDRQSISQWIHPPFSGHFDGEYIWGRGSCDDKSGLVAILSAVETLLENDFSPKRTIVLAFGIDEERGGRLGAAQMSEYLLATYGENAFAFLVDEGGVNTVTGSYSQLYGAIFALPAIAEKGSLDILIEVSAPGGHSSIPPAHTSIGILAKLISELEDNPHPRELGRDVTYYQGLQCFAKYGPTVPSHLRHLITDSLTDDRALKRLDEQLIRSGLEYQASVATTQAVDIIHGGVKVNALPESAYAIVNHRIMELGSVQALKDRVVNVVSPTVEKYNLSLDAFGETRMEERYGISTGFNLKLSESSDPLEPAPITPTDAAPWNLLSGTILATLETSTRQSRKGFKKYVAPGLFLANTDTRHYWSLTKHIFRYNHQDPNDKFNGAHTVNEAIKADGYLETIRFFTRLILNADETQMFN